MSAPPPPRLKVNTLWMMGGQVARTAVQAVYFILIARALGPVGYGAFVAATALVAIASPYASWGSGNLLVRAVAREPAQFGVYWGMALWVSGTLGVVMTGLIALVSRGVLPGSVPTTLVVLVALADLLCFRLIDLCGQAYQAFQRLRRTAQLQLFPVLLRLVAVMGMTWSLHDATALDWAWLFLGTTLVAAAVSLWLVTRELGWPTFRRGMARRELREGFHFATSLSAQNIYNDIDKTLLARLSTLGAAGVYGVAYRIIDVAFAPVRALLAAAYARFFQHGQAGIRGSLGFALRLLPAAAGYAMVAALGLVAMGPVLVLILGAEYGEVAIALRYLAPIPLLRVAHYFAADALTGAGHQAARSVVQIGVALLNVGLNLVLIPRYGWRGAAVTSIASDACLALGLWLLVARYARRPVAQVPA